MVSKYYINQNGHQLGPWTYEEILAEIKASRLTCTDYIFDDEKKDWVFLLEFSLFAEHVSGSSSWQQQNLWASKSNNHGEIRDHKENVAEEWFVLKGEENKYGPFSYLDLVKMLQEKNLLEYDYVWTSSLDEWKRISEIAEFSPEKIKELKKIGLAKVAKVFFRRKHARAQYGASILLHDNKSVWKGQSLEVSPGGAGLLIESDEVQIGQNLFLHFKAGEGVPAFNAACLIVSKQSGSGNLVRYGVKFTTISRSVQAAIKKYTDRAA